MDELLATVIYLCYNTVKLIIQMNVLYTIKLRGKQVKDLCGPAAVNVSYCNYTTERFGKVCNNAINISQKTCISLSLDGLFQMNLFLCCKFGLHIFSCSPFFGLTNKRRKILWNSSLLTNQLKMNNIIESRGTHIKEHKGRTLLRVPWPNLLSGQLYCGVFSISIALI